MGSTIKSSSKNIDVESIDISINETIEIDTCEEIKKETPLQKSNETKIAQDPRKSSLE